MFKGPRNPGRISEIRRSHQVHVDRVWEHFSRDMLRTICEMPERRFAREYDMTVEKVWQQRSPADFYAFKDHGSNILAVAHLDTVAAAKARTCRFIETEAGPVVFSRALDDRLGAYIVLDLLPKLGLRFDVLLTLGEEQGQSTAAFFEPQKPYNWVIEFDRGGTDVVMYQYHDEDTAELVEASGADVGHGSLSDISYLDHLGVKAFNWGVGYRDYHYPRAHAFLNDTVEMVGHFLKFHAANKDTRLEHTPAAGDDLWADGGWPRTSQDYAGLDIFGAWDSGETSLDAERVMHAWTQIVQGPDEEGQ